jgi:hypothetical protein
VSVYSSGDSGADGKWRRAEIATVEAEIRDARDRAAALQIIGDREIADALNVAAGVAVLPLIVLAGLR